MTVYTYDDPQENPDPTREPQPIREPVGERPVQVAAGPVPPPGEPSAWSGQPEGPPQAPAAGSAQPMRQILGKPIISILNGQKLGAVQDVLIDPQELRVAALLLSRGGIFNREVAAIPVRDIQAWGVHAVMVDRPDVAVPREELPGSERWVSISGQIYGRPLLSMDGTKIGEVEDVEIDASGRLASYNLGEGDERSTSRGGQKIPARYTRSIGRDVIIVDRA